MKIFDNIEKIVAFGLTVFWFGLACGDVGQHFDAGTFSAGVPFMYLLMTAAPTGLAYIAGYKDGKRS